MDVLLAKPRVSSAFLIMPPIPMSSLYLNLCDCEPMGQAVHTVAYDFGSKQKVVYQMMIKGHYQGHGPSVPRHRSALDVLLLKPWSGLKYHMASQLKPPVSSYHPFPCSSASRSLVPLPIQAKKLGRYVYIRLAKGGNGTWPQWFFYSPIKSLNYLVQNCLRLEPVPFKTRPLNFLFQNIGPFTTPTTRRVAE